MLFVGAMCALAFGIKMLQLRAEIMNSVVLDERGVGTILAYLGTAAVSISCWLYSLGLLVG